MADPEKFGRYEVKKVLGRGAMGVVYLGEDPVIGRKVAIKVMLSQPELDGDELRERQERFEREFRSAGTLAHPNVVSIYDVGHQDDQSFIAMEFVAGKSLEDELGEGKDMSLEEASRIAREVGAGLDYAHERGIVHRDVKPANILLTEAGIAKITDFGVAKLDSADMTTTGMILGTPRYMAPEQVTGRKITGASDQFSLAVILYEMLTQERPFQGEGPTTVMFKIVQEEPARPHDINRNLPESIDQALLRALAKDPEKRYSSCAAMVEAVTAALSGKAIEEDETMVLNAEDTAEMLAQAGLDLPERESEQTRTDANKKPPVWAIAAGAAAVVGLGGWFLISNLGGSHEATEGTAAAPTEASALEAAAPYSGQLGISSDPAGASILLNGEDTSLVTPANLPLTGTVGEDAQIELAWSGTTIASTILKLGPDIGATWAPDVTLPTESFEITSQPAGATISIDGESIGEVTPATVDLSPGIDYRLGVKLSGYDAGGRTFSLDDLNDSQRAEHTLHFGLQKSIPPGVVAIQAPYAVGVEVGGRTYRPTTNQKINLRPGRYEMRIFAPDVFYNATRSVNVSSQQTVDIRLPQSTSVTLAATPSNCRVSINGQDAGFVPVTVKVTLGAQQFEFNWSRLGQSVSFTEQVRPNTDRIFRAAPN